MNTAAEVRGYARTSVMPLRRVLGSYLTELKYELVHALRSPAYIVFAFGFPVMFYLLAGSVFGFLRLEDTNTTTYILIGFVLMGSIMPGFSGFGVALAIEREKGLHTLRRAQPMPAAANIIGKAVLAMLSVAIVAPILMTAGVLFGNVPLSLTEAFALLGLAVVCCLPFCALGFFIGMHASARAAQPIVNVSFIPMLYLSGAFYPLPDSFSWVAYATPPFYVQQLMLAAADLPHQFLGSAGTHVGVLTAITVLFTLRTIRRFKAVG
jgi:ABC-2 type transport system permease protein